MEPPPATRELVERGVEDPKRFVPNAELTVERDRIVIRDEEQRVAESFDLKRVAEPTAFKSRQGTNFVLFILVPTFCTHMVDT